MYRRSKHTRYLDRELPYAEILAYIIFVQAIYALDLAIFANSVWRMNPAQIPTPVCIR